MIKCLTISKASLMAICLGMVMAVSSCKKDDVVEPETPVNPEDPKSSTRAELTKDSLFLYAKEVYLWNKSLPTYEVFNPRKYTGTSDLDSYEAELFAITQLSINPATNAPYEYRPSAPTYPKFSYIDDITGNNSAQSFVVREKSDVELDGSGYDLGFLWFMPYGTQNSFQFYVMGVFPNSPAAKVGLTRGAIINEVNGQKIGTNYSTQGSLVYNIVDGDPSSVTISGIKADGTTFTKVTLTKVKYQSSPVYKAKTITSGSKKIGYMAFARFSELKKTAKADLDKVFTDFVSDGVTDLIIDLRYNGGGYVETAEYLTNLIAPSTVTGVMFKEFHNETMQANKATILKHQPLLDENDKLQFQGKDTITYADLDYSPAANTRSFSKKGSLGNVKNIVFIVTGNTASASELVINSLKPHMTVKLVGSTTYGKPVGFFPIRLENKYDVYMSMFETKNSRDEGGYYAGMAPDIADNDRDIFDDAMFDFGDEQEAYLSAAITSLAPATSGATSSRSVMSIRGKQMSTSSALGLAKDGKNIKQFVGMIETRHKIK